MSDCWRPADSSSAFSRADFRWLSFSPLLMNRRWCQANGAMSRQVMTFLFQASRPSWNRLVPRISVLSTSKNARIGRSLGVGGRSSGIAIV
jgi:hypothetical protein